MARIKLPRFIRDNYEVHEWRHALAILTSDFRQEYDDIVDVLSRFRLHKSWISVGGGRKSQISEWIDGELTSLGWVAKNFETKVTVDQASYDSPTHEIDCFKNKGRPGVLHMRDIIVEVRGGSVVEVYSESPSVRLLVLDWDNLDAGDGAPLWDRTARLNRMPEDTRRVYDSLPRRH